MLRLIVVKRISVTLAVTALLVGCTRAEQAGLGAGTEPSPSPTFAGEEPAPVPDRTGPLGDGGAAASCAEGYNVQTIGNRAFAFDGAVTAIESGGTNRPDKGHLDTAAVTFQVNEWFEGGQGETVTVDLMAPTSSVGGDVAPAYERGTRLLVSGEPRWGGAALDDAIAWSCGGFTRYYEAAVADEWRSGTASSPPSPALLGVSLTCDRRNARSAEGTVRGTVANLAPSAVYALNVVQGTDAALGSVALPLADATGTVTFEVSVSKVQTEQPVRVVLRQSGVRSLTALVEVTPDAATCAEG